MAVRGKPTLPWLLLLVAVTAVLPTNADYSDNDIRLIVQNVFRNYPVLADFPRTTDYPTGRQFAIVILISRQDYANGNTNITLIPFPMEMTINNRYPVQPGPHVRVNYMVARPDTPREAGSSQRVHAERKLCDNLGQLMNKYLDHHHQPPGMILLYTWATPCPRCTNVTLRGYNNLCRPPRVGIPFTLAYSADRAWRGSGMTLEGNEANRRKLCRLGVNVVLVGGEGQGMGGNGEGNGAGSRGNSGGENGGGRNGGGRRERYGRGPVEVVSVLDMEVMARSPVEVVYILDMEVMALGPVVVVYVLDVYRSYGSGCSRSRRGGVHFGRRSYCSRCSRSRRGGVRFGRGSYGRGSSRGGVGFGRGSYGRRSSIGSVRFGGIGGHQLQPYGYESFLNLRSVLIVSASSVCLYVMHNYV